MRRFITLLLAFGLLPVAGLGLVAADHAPATGCAAHVYLDGHDTGRRVPIAPDRPEYAQLCAPVASPSPPPSPAPDAGWHDPAAHEHGDPPPQWVRDSGHPPFTQSRESHAGYKGVYDVSPGGAESYFIAHVVATVGARSHGDHDYQLWLRSPASGEVLYREGVLDFGDPPPLRTRDTGERPIILSVGDGGCETWYSRPGVIVADVGWTICGRYQDFAGQVDGGAGTFRTMDWIVPCTRLPAESTLREHCRVEFGVPRLSFIVNSRDYQTGPVVPVN